MLKSGARILVWGWSLDYVPHIVGRRGLRWHRTAKSVRFDLRYDPIDYVKSGGLLRWMVPFGLGTPVEETHRRAQAVVSRALTEAPSLWDGVKSIADLPRAFQAKRDRPFTRFGFENYVQEPLAEAFTFAALGQARARALLEAYVKQFGVDPVAADGLRERLEERLEAPLHPGGGD